MGGIMYWLYVRDSQGASGKTAKDVDPAAHRSAQAPQDWVLQLQRTAGNQAVARLSGGGGEPLDPETRTAMEAQLGGDFSSVRVHTDESAAAAARAHDARALTTGSDVYFAPGAYAPRTNSGRALLAHELAHVLQQSRAARTAAAAASDTLETEAQHAAATPARASVTPGAAPAGSVQLAKKGEPPPTTTTSIAPKAPEMKPPPAVEEARKLQQRAQQLQEHLPPADRNRTVLSGANSDYISGTQPRSGFEHVSANEVARQAGRIGHPPTAGGFLDPTRTGEAADVHAEAKHATAEPGVPKGVGRPMCPSCQALHLKQAIATGKTETVGDPQMVREFKPNGDIVEWHNDGRVITRGAAAASAAPGPEQTGTSFRRALTPPPKVGVTPSAAEAPSVKTTPSVTAAETPPVKTTPPVTAAEVPPVKAEVPSATPLKAVAEGGATSGLKGAEVKEGAAAARVGRPGFTLRRVGGVVAQFAIWMMVDYILSKWGDMRERAEIAELMTANVEPRINQRLAELNDEAQRLTIENPYATVHANVTVNLRYRGTADKYGVKREGIRDVTFYDLQLSLKPEEDFKEGEEVTGFRGPYEITRTATFPLPLQFPETAERLESRQLRFSAQKLVEAGIAARGFAEAATFWSEQQTERFIQAYIGVSTGQQHDDAVKYLEEIRTRSPGWRSAQWLPALPVPPRFGPTIERARP